jgi:hypothetical protein
MDWSAVWRNWIRKEEKNGTAKSGKHHKPKASYLDKVQNAGAIALRMLEQSERDFLDTSGQKIPDGRTWGNPLGAPEGTPALTHRDHEKMAGSKNDDLFPQGEGIDSSDI